MRGRATANACAKIMCKHLPPITENRARYTALVDYPEAFPINGNLGARTPVTHVQYAPENIPIDIRSCFVQGLLFLRDKFES